MAVNFLKVTKEDNEQFSFVLNSDLDTEIVNTRNDLFTVGNECHFKTSNGANIIKEQNVLYSNVSLFNGASPIAAPTSIRDLFDKLTALGYFDWMLGGGGGGENRFTSLSDTFQYPGKAGQFVVVADDELRLTTKEITQITNSKQLSDMPDSISPNKMLIGNATGTAYIAVDPPAGANGLRQQFEYTTGDQIFALGTSSSLSAVFWNGALLDDSNWEQDGNNLKIIGFELNNGDKIKPIGNT